MRFLGVFWLCAASSVLAADTTWKFDVTPVDGKPFTSAAGTLDNTGFRSAGAGRPAPIPWGNIESVTTSPPTVWHPDDVVVRVIKEDGRDRITSNIGKVKLRKGYHRFELPYAHTATKYKKTLKLDYKGPGQSSWTEVSSSMLKKQQDWRWPKETVSPGLDSEGYRLPDQPAKVEKGLKCRYLSWEDFGPAPSRLVDLRHTPLVQFSGSAKIQPPNHKSDQIAVIFRGLLKVPQDGEYRFRLRSDGLAALSIGPPVPKISERIFPYQESDWRAELAYSGQVIGPWTAFENGVLTFALPHGPNRDNPDTAKVALPRGLVKRVVFNTWDGKFPRVNAADDQDIVYAEGSSGKVRGVVGKAVAVRDEKLVFEYDGQERTVPLDRLRGIVFAKSELTSGQPPAEPVVVVRLFGEQKVPARIVHDENHWIYTFAPLGHDNLASLTKDSPGTFALNLTQLRGFSVYGGGKFSLRDLDVDIARKPLFDLAPAFGVDESPAGSKLRIGKNVYQSGYAVGPKTSLTFILGGTFNTLKTTIGMQAVEGDRGEAAVRVLGDGRVLYENDTLTSRDGAIDVRAELNGADRLTFEVDFGPNFDVGDVVVFAEPEVLRAFAASETPADPTSKETK